MMSPTRIPALALCGLVVLVAEPAAADLSATTRQPVHPVLIRLERNEVARVAIDFPKGRPARVTELRFSLRGTEDLSDIEALELLRGAEQVGVRVPSDEEVRFALDWPAREGVEEFTLACRLKASADLSGHVSAVCTGVATSVGDFTPRDLTPGVRHRIGFALRRHNDDGVHTYRIPALTRTPRGTLLCVYDMRRRAGRDLQEDIDIGLSRSVDAGRTWESPRVIMDMGTYGGLPQEQNGCSDPGIIVDPATGSIFCFAVWMNGKPGKHQWREDGSEPGFEIGKSAQFLMVRSDDDGKTWSKPENLTRKLKKAEWVLFAPSPQSGFALADGTLVMPAQGRDPRGAEFSTIMASRDHGASWTVGSPAYSGGSECQAALLSDGSIMLNMRNDNDRARAVFVTRDLGKTWVPHPTNRKTLIEPNCNASLLRLDLEGSRKGTHALVFSNPHSTKARTHQTIQVSLDDGMTWPEARHLLLDEGRGAGYSSLTRVDDEHVGIVYEGSRAHIVFERVPIRELVDPSGRGQ